MPYLVGVFLKLLPDIAASPLTNPPIKPVIKINTQYEPPNGNRCATLVDNICSLAVSFKTARIVHKINKPLNPAKKAIPGFWWIAIATINEVNTNDHQGNMVNNPIEKARKPVKKIAVINFIKKI